MRGSRCWRSRRALAGLVAAVGTVALGLPAAVSAARAASSTPPAPTYAYATMADGTKIAVVVSYPAGYQPGHKYPAIFEMDGYDGGGGALDPSQWDNRYVMVHASIRGTGCSTGQFDLFSWADSEDGAQIVEGWIPSQPWSDGRVGIIGHSYPGLTGFMTAERIGYDLSKGDFGGIGPGGVPRHSALKAVAVSGLIDDLYKGITYMGGVPDLGFPLLWAGAERPASELTGNLDRIYSTTTAGDPSCLEAYAEHELALDPLNPDLTPILDNPILNGFADMAYGPWWAAHSLDTYESYLGFTDAPVHMEQQYQDEQTGPRGGARLFEELEAEDPGFRVTLPYRIVFDNGRHDSFGPADHPDEQNWLDCYEAQLPQACSALGQPSADPASWTDSGHGGATYAATSTTDACPGEAVVMYFETTGNFDATSSTAGTHVNPPLCASAFPVPRSEWTRYYLDADGALSTSPGPPGSRSYLSVLNGRDDYPGPTELPVDSLDTQLYSSVLGPLLSSPGPDELTYRSAPFAQETTLEGPIEADLWAQSTSPDTDYFVQLIDEAPNGAEQFLQYGLLRASFRAVDSAGSSYENGVMYWPDHPYTTTSLLTPLQVYEVNIEVFPLGWVFRPGHRLVVEITAPPVLDQLYSWVASARPPGINTILSGPGHPSSVLLPFLAVNPHLPAQAPACGAQVGVRCATPAETSTGSGL
jgi:predicted acyl esterase